MIRRPLERQAEQGRASTDSPEARSRALAKTRPIYRPEVTPRHASDRSWQVAV